MSEWRKVVRIEEPLECLIVERVNRFVVKVDVNGKHRMAYINNTGRLLEYLIKGRRGFCVEAKKHGKTGCRLFSVEENSLGAIIDTRLQMMSFEESLMNGSIPWLKRCRILRRNARLGKSLIDYLLECDGKRFYLEVKSAVLRSGKYSMYPDCPSSRGRRQIEDLTNDVREGGNGVILFISAIPGAEVFKPNRPADPEMYELLLRAYESGVRMKSIGLHYNPEDSSIYLYNPDLEVDLL